MTRLYPDNRRICLNSHIRVTGNDQPVDKNKTFLYLRRVRVVWSTVKKRRQTSRRVVVVEMIVMVAVAVVVVVVMVIVVVVTVVVVVMVVMMVMVIMVMDYGDFATPNEINRNRDNVDEMKSNSSYW